MELIFITVVAALITALATPFTIMIARIFNMVDDPFKSPEPKKVHQRIIPRAGGLAIYLGILISIMFFVPVEQHIIGIILGLTVLLVVGLADDRLIKFSP